ncbi:MFS transporter [Tropicimonas sediminicola]|uniref:MFS transporter, DHA1 family, inner membrane transport protein n=1 Tax=Tropicimonas sediminicola TaxID=1031541 RepID=A0A239LAJ7_9RHOB|nr:MFS transporter [Tropicimonas sediminicola]SNT26679.1 MFS transporter, DHA1 family, inner membrane transport protein [Tropicimonas sediminicola]
MPLALWALTISAFAVGTTEFVIVGLIPTIAADLGVSLPSAGLLVSLYALGVTIGAPVLTALAGSMPRKRLLLALLALFIAGNAFAAFAPGYDSLVAARFITGLAHGVFFAIASTIATDLVDREKESSAIALVFMGLTVALVTGVPLGTWIGQTFGWQSTFLGVVALGLIGLVASALLVPSNLRRAEAPSLSAQVQVLTSPRLLLVYLITAVGYGGNFIAFTFLAPMLTDVTGLSAGSVSLVILLYGASVAAGNILGGKLADRLGPVPSLTLIFAGLALMLVALGFGLTNAVFTVAVVGLWGGFAFANVPPLQSYVVQIAREVAPGAVDVASGLNIGAFNLGIAFGAWAGGLIVVEFGLSVTPFIGAGVVATGIVLVRLSGQLDTVANVVPAE